MVKETLKSKKKNGKKRRHYSNKIKKWKNAVSVLIIVTIIGIAHILSLEFNKCISSYIGTNELLGLIASFFAMSLLLFEIYKVMNSDETKRFFSGTKGNLKIFDTIISKILLITALFMSLLAFSLFFSIIFGFLTNSKSVFLVIVMSLVYISVIVCLGFSIAIAFLPKSFRDLLY